MARTKVDNGRDTQISGEPYIKVYQRLLKQKYQIDKEIGKVNDKILKEVDKGNRGRTVAQKYVRRIPNKMTLVAAIRSCMRPGKEMKMKDIMLSLKKKGEYHTNSKYFYTMVNNKLNRDPLIEKPKDESGKTIRGTFIYHPMKGKQVSAIT